MNKSLVSYFILGLIVLSFSASKANPDVSKQEREIRRSRAIQLVKLHKPQGASETLGQYLSANERIARLNHLKSKNKWSAASAGNYWIVTLITDVGDPSPDVLAMNTARWRVKLKPVQVEPINELSKGLEKDMNNLVR